jgi:hypothetical protein
LSGQGRPADFREPYPRHSQGAVAIDRIVGDNATNAMSRLCWAAELTQDVAVYGPTVEALS